MKKYRLQKENNKALKQKNSCLFKTIFVGLFFIQLLYIATSLHAKTIQKPVISRQPANATYAENATARFYVNAHSIDGGYLTYQWYR